MAVLCSPSGLMEDGMFAHCLSKAGLDLENLVFAECFCRSKCYDFYMHNTRKMEEISHFAEKLQRHETYWVSVWRSMRNLFQCVSTMTNLAQFLTGKVPFHK